MAVISSSYPPLPDALVTDLTDAAGHGFDAKPILLLGDRSYLASALEFSVVPLLSSIFEESSAPGTYLLVDGELTATLGDVELLFLPRSGTTLHVERKTRLTRRSVRSNTRMVDGNAVIFIVDTERLAERYFSGGTKGSRKRTSTAGPATSPAAPGELVERLVTESHVFAQEGVDVEAAVMQGEALGCAFVSAACGAATKMHQEVPARIGSGVRKKPVQPAKRQQNLVSAEEEKEFAALALVWGQPGTVEDEDGGQRKAVRVEEMLSECEKLNSRIAEASLHSAEEMQRVQSALRRRILEICVGPGGGAGGDVESRPQVVQSEVVSPDQAETELPSKQKVWMCSSSESDVEIGSPELQFF
mmetsp:Transcript_13980/g.34568  ORF Transcript_13980/g.34568 Transcript_13980/m.34568 type:complete len:360 (+) Transcript_13980:131-1210(+)